MKVFCRLVASFLLLVSVATAESPTIVESNLGKKLDSYCQSQTKLGFSGSILMAIDNKVALQKGYGLANRQRKISNSPETLFEIASLAKQFTAAAILTLEDDEKLSTDDLISTHLPNVPNAYQNVTIYHLLTHTGGLPRGGAGRGLDLSKAVTDHLALPPQFPPGKKYLYSNAGYALLAGIVENASGKRFEDYCHERLFKRAGLNHTGFCGEEFDASIIALGYSENEQQGRLPQQDPYPPLEAFGYEYRGMGGVLSNATDLHRWVIALRGNKVLSEAARRKLFQPFRSNHACGWEVFAFPEGQRCIGHGGSVQGYVCKLWTFPDDDALIIVLSNQGKFNYQMLNVLKNTLFNEPHPPAVQRRHANPFAPRIQQPLPPPPVVELTNAYLKSLAGTYSCDAPERFLLQLRPQDGGLQADLSAPSVSPIKERFFEEAKIAEKVISSIAKADPAPLATHMHHSIPTSWPLQMKNSIWPEHQKTWGKLSSLKIMQAETRQVNNEAWNFIWFQLKHAKGNCLTCTVFRPDHQLQLLVLNANKYLCRAGDVFLPRSKTEFRPNQGHLVSLLSFHDDGRVLLERRNFKLTFQREVGPSQ